MKFLFFYLKFQNVGIGGMNLCLPEILPVIYLVFTCNFLNYSNEVVHFEEINDIKSKMLSFSVIKHANTIKQYHLLKSTQYVVRTNSHTSKSQ